MFCTSCGNPIPEGNPYCTVCGKSVELTSQPTEQAKASPTPAPAPAVDPIPVPQAFDSELTVCEVPPEVLQALAAKTAAPAAAPHPRFCIGCGKVLGATTRFCTACGRPAEPAEGMAVEEPIPVAPMTEEGPATVADPIPVDQRFCTGCGNPLSKDTRFCTACGKPVAPITVAPTDPTPVAPAPMAVEEPIPAAEPMTAEMSAAPNEAMTVEPLSVVEETPTPMAVDAPSVDIPAPMPEDPTDKQPELTASKDDAKGKTDEELMSLLATVAAEAPAAPTEPTLPETEHSVRGHYVYKVLSKSDERFSGKPSPASVEALLNAYAAEGWRVISFEAVDWRVPAADFLAVLEKELS